MSSKPSIPLPTLLHVWLENLMSDGLPDLEVTKETQAVLSAHQKPGRTPWQGWSFWSRTGWSSRGRLAGARVF